MLQTINLYCTKVEGTITVYYYKPILLGNGYFPHRWGILLFTPPPGSRAKRLGWLQYMHECVGASQGYHGVVGGLGLGLGLAVGWLAGSWRWGKYGFCPTGVGIPLYP